MKHRTGFNHSIRIGLPIALVLATAAQARTKQNSGPRAAETNNRSTSAAAASRESAGQREYVIGPEDVLAVDVWQEPEISRVEPVRPDGKITLPLVGEIQASGQTTGSLQAEITRKLTSFIRQPAVTVIVQEINSHRFNIIGDVRRPGSYPLETRMNVLDALAVAGGFSEFAKTSRIYVVRQLADGSSLRIPFNYRDAVRGDERDLDLDLMPGDTIIVP